MARPLAPQPPQGVHRADQLTDRAVECVQAVHGPHVITTRIWWGTQVFIECRCGWSGEWFPGTDDVCLVGEAEGEFAADLETLWARHRTVLDRLRRRSDEDARERDQAMVRASGGA